MAVPAFACNEDIDMEYADIETADGEVIGKLDLSTMRVLAPNRRVDQAIADGKAIYMNKNGIRSILSEKPVQRRR